MRKSRIFAVANMSGAVTLLTLALRGSALAHCYYNCDPSVPELDPHTMGVALAVFGGAAALLVERYRRRKR
jgi:hypothetical protein